MSSLLLSSSLLVFLSNQWMSLSSLLLFFYLYMHLMILWGSDSYSPRTLDCSQST
jgi:hypothetical protein